LLQEKGTKKSGEILSQQQRGEGCHRGKWSRGVRSSSFHSEGRERTEGEGVVDLKKNQLAQGDGARGEGMKKNVSCLYSPKRKKTGGKFLAEHGEGEKKGTHGFLGVRLSKNIGGKKKRKKENKPAEEKGEKIKGT